jgi:hypothetical protein
MATNVPNQGQFLGDIATFLTGVRDSFGALENKRDYITAMGGVTFLTAAAPDGLGMTTADADALIATLDQHHDLDQHYTGVTAAPLLNYEQNGAAYWGGR